MSNCFYVYEWVRIDTLDPFYVGKGKGDRCYSFKSRNKHFNDVIKYCIRNNIDIMVSILHDGLSEEEALAYECYYIHHYIVEMGYNLTNKTWGGDGGNHFSLLTKEEQLEYSRKMSTSCMGKNSGHKHSPQTIELIKQNRGNTSGRNNPFYGRHHTEETRRKLSKISSELNVGRKHTEATKRKMSESQKGISKKGSYKNRIYTCECVICKKIFEAKNKAKYCSDECKKVKKGQNK